MDMNRVAIQPQLVHWACERAGIDAADLAGKFPQLSDWLAGAAQPTLKQLEALAKTTHTPVGYLFLPEPPVETIPIPDFRTPGNERIGHPSPNLLDTIYVCQQRQEWFRNYARSMGEQPLAFVGSARVQDDVVSSAARIRSELGFSVEARRRMATWTDALRHFIEQADGLGILVMCNAVVHNNNHRHLDPQEFRGFAMADDLAPLVFINGADTKAAQMFTLAHELAHIWAGESAVSDSQPTTVPVQQVERWCNEVAAELLVPLDAMRQAYHPDRELKEEACRLAHRFKVSTLVILRRILDAGGLTQEEFREAYHAEVARLRAIPRRSGGNFYLTQAARVGKRFATALCASTLEGQTRYTDTFRMLGFSKLATLKELERSLGVGVA
ncbi:MAG: ImmA/IrrE family metallo-endopeptidase [Verrucomicrobiae bacterium]|nr:ImmA/IrrE family metallo-endopeptidase [Verrucomicrobiae bacterium]